MTEHRILEQDTFRIVATSSVARELRARVVVRYDNGLRRRFVGQMGASPTNRTPDSANFGFVEFDGVVERATVVSVDNIKRGQVYVELAVLDQEEQTQDILCQDYIHDNNQLVLGRYHGSGPGGGNGFKQNSAIASNVTPVSIQHTLSVSNGLRRIDGFIWYYHCSSDVATRTMRANVRDLGNGLPTGMTSGDNTRVQRWPSAGAVTLTADEEGFIFVSGLFGKAGFATSSDTGTQTIEATTTQPIPFPYWAQESDVGEIFFDVGNPQAADRHTIYIIREEWIEV